MAEQQNGQEQDLNHLLKVRREKLTELQDSGRGSVSRSQNTM